MHTQFSLSEDLARGKSRTQQSLYLDAVWTFNCNPPSRFSWAGEGEEFGDLKYVGNMSIYLAIMFQRIEVGHAHQSAYQSKTFQCSLPTLKGGNKESKDCWNGTLIGTHVAPPLRRHKLVKYYTAYTVTLTVGQTG